MLFIYLSTGKVSVACQTIELDQTLTSTPLVVLARPCGKFFLF